MEKYKKLGLVGGFAISILASCVNLGYAAEIKQDLEQKKKEIELYEQSGKIFDAAFCASSAGLKEKASVLWEKASIEAENMGRYDLAAAAIDNSGQRPNERTRMLHEKASMQKEELGDLFSAAIHAQEAGLEERAIELYMKCEDFSSAGSLLEKIGKKEMAKECYAKQSVKYEEDREFDFAERFAKLAGQKQRATEMGEKYKEHTAVFGKGGDPYTTNVWVYNKNEEERTADEQSILKKEVVQETRELIRQLQEIYNSKEIRWKVLGDKAIILCKENDDGSCILNVFYPKNKQYILFNIDNKRTICMTRND